MFEDVSTFSQRAIAYTIHVILITNSLLEYYIVVVEIFDSATCIRQRLTDRFSIQSIDTTTATFHSEAVDAFTGKLSSIRQCYC